MRLDLELRPRHLALLAGSVAVLAAVATSPQLLGGLVAEGVAGLDEASPVHLWLSGCAFAASLLSAASAWAFALRRCGGDTSRLDAAARYCTGSLVNALAPARLGTAVRLALFARTLPSDGRLWTVGGVASCIGAVRSLWLAAVLALGSASGALPRWPVALLLLGVLAAAAVTWRARNSRPGSHWAHVLDAYRVLGQCPRAAAQLAAWVGLAMAARVAGAAGIAAAFGISRPLAAALVVVPALDLAGLLPLTPGNVGVASAAVAFALTAHGAVPQVAVSAGIAFGAVETLTTLALGSASLLLFGARRAGERRWQAAAVGATGCLALGGAFGATVIVPLI